MISLPQRGLIVLAGLIVALGSASSRAAEEKATGSVDGKITLDGRPLPAGKIGFHPKEGKPVVAIVKGGAYSIKEVPAGTMAVTIEGKGVSRVYSAKNTTPLRIEIKEGMNVGVDIQLTVTSRVPGDDKPFSSVDGKVTFKGKPLPAGKVAFHPKEGKPVVALLAADGTYSAKEVPIGVTRITIESKLVPEKYAAPETSGLQVELLKGKNTIDLDLN